MKASVFGISDFPFGKKSLSDERVNKIKELFKSAKATQIQIEFTTEDGLKAADAIVCLKEKKLDLIILDMEVAESRSEKELSEEEKSLLSRCQALFEKETPLCEGGFSKDELAWIANNNFVTIKPVIFFSRDEIEDASVLAKKAFGSAGMITFLTGGPKEARGWELRSGSTAVDAAGCIHSDIARGFIRADVMAYQDLARIGNVNQAKNEGCLHQEGKEYIVKDGDIIEFKFNV